MPLTKIIMFASWAVLAIYLATNVWLGSHVSVKELSHNLQMQGVTGSEYIDEMVMHESQPVIKVRNAMIPIWNHNYFIYPGLIFFAGFLTFIHYKKPSNKSTQPTARGGG